MSADEAMVLPVELTEQYAADPRVPILVRAFGVHRLVAISTLAKLDATLIPDQPEPLPHIERKLARAVAEAWINAGPVPFYHRAQQQRLEREWPTLRNAVVALARGLR